jgi:predicted AAA+ superfamily ATPase
MKRKAEVELWAWFNKKNRMPLIMRGARQVGKSTLVRLFCQNYKLDLIELNLEIINFNTLEQTNFNIENLHDEIQLLSKKK